MLLRGRVRYFQPATHRRIRAGTTGARRLGCHVNEGEGAAFEVDELVIDGLVRAFFVEHHLDEPSLAAAEVESLRAAAGRVVGSQQVFAFLEDGVENGTDDVEGNSSARARTGSRAR